MTDILLNKYRPFVMQTTRIDGADKIDVYQIYARWAKKRGIVNFNQVPFPKLSRYEIEKVIKTLPGDFRLVQVLSLLASFSYREIAEILRVDFDMIRDKVRIGRKILQRNIFQLSDLFEIPINTIRNQNENDIETA